MMDATEREAALAKMRAASHDFYYAAIKIGVHPFIEFTGLMNEYIKLCEGAHKAGTDFTECNKHSGEELPMQPFEIDYMNEKLECIFNGRIMISDAAVARLRQEVNSLRTRLAEATAYADRCSEEAGVYLCRVAQLRSLLEVERERVRHLPIRASDRPQLSPREMHEALESIVADMRGDYAG